MWGHNVWRPTSSKCLNKLAWFLAHINAVLYNFNLIKFNKVVPPGKSYQPGFSSWRVLREFQHKMLSKTSLDSWIKMTATVSRKTWRWRLSTVCLNISKRACLRLDMIYGEVWRKHCRRQLVLGLRIKSVPKVILTWRRVAFLQLWPNGWMDEDATWYSSFPLFGPCLLWPNSRPSQQLLSSC